MTAWYEIFCSRCEALIGETSNTMPLPCIYCPQCAEAERNEERESEEE